MDGAELKKAVCLARKVFTETPIFSRSTPPGRKLTRQPLPRQIQGRHGKVMLLRSSSEKGYFRAAIAFVFTPSAR